jgi:hypothetical protein
MQRRNERDQVETLIEDCTAVLEGRYAERLRTTGAVRAPWAWLNLLAHGLPVDLQQAAAAGRRGTTSTGGWYAARAFLAGEVLDAGGEMGSLVELQRRALIPLEMDLMSGDVTARSPRRLVEEVLERIEHAARRPRS